MKGRSMLVLCAVILCASPALAQPDDAQIIAAVRARLTGKQATSFGGRTMPCSAFFTVGAIRVIDRQTSPNVMRVAVQAVITAKQRADAQSFASTDCYGAPQGGWNAGQSANYADTFVFERWDSGWRLK